MTEEPTQTVSHALPAGFVIQEYEFLSVLGMGGFGITYLANDANLKLKVAIKEFFPASLATRDPVSNQVAVKSEEYQADFAWGKERFIQEAQTLAKFSHPNIVHIYRYFVANGTGYMVMDYEEGKSLEAELNDKEIQWDDARVMEFLLPLLDGIAHVHKAGFLHRDIKPGNIVIRKKDSSPVLLDFGSARAALISHTQTLTALVSPGYCPVEQYFDDGTQAACTDIYSIGAVLYRIVTGVTPTPSPQRVKKDSMVPAGFAGRQKFGVPLLRAIDKALSIEASKRPQSIEAWQAILQESAQKAELKNVSEKTGRFVGKGYRKIEKNILMLVIASVIIFLGYLYGFGMDYYNEHRAKILGEQNKLVQEQYNRARQGDTVALQQLKLSAAKGNAYGQYFLGFIYKDGQGVPKDNVQAVAWYRKAAEQGNADAQNNLGFIYKNGQGVPKDEAQAVVWYRKLAEQGDAEAQVKLGFMYRDGQGVPKDEAEAISWFRKAAEQGNASAQTNLGLMYLNGQGVAKDEAQATAWFRKAAEQGNSFAQANLGSMYRNGRGVPKDEAQATAWYRKAAEQDNDFAQVQLGYRYGIRKDAIDRQGVPKDVAQSLAWYRKAAEQGDDFAQYNLAKMYLDGVSVPQDYAEAVKWYRKAAESGNVRAQLLLSALYERGQGVPKDGAQAATWLRKAAEQGNELAQRLIGLMYFDGKVVTKDETQAISWFRKAAEQGNASAQLIMFSAYREGRGVQKNYSQAISWLRKAAKQGYVSAQVTLGDMYKSGEGVPKDYAEALKWYRKAAEQNNAKAQNSLADMYESGLGVPKDHEQAEIWRKKALATQSK